MHISWNCSATCTILFWHQDNLRARYVQDIRSFEYSVRLEELGGFFRDQHWRHMHDVLRSRGITFHELGHQGLEASLAILEAEEITRREALREIGLQRRRGALASLEVQEFTEERGGGIGIDRARLSWTQRIPSLPRGEGIYGGGGGGIGIDRVRS